MVQLENLNLPHIYVYPTLIITTLLYMVTMFCNMMVLLAIARCKELHQPMFILLFNLPISDMIGTTAFLPQLLWSIVTQYRSIPYTACITQAFLIHMYGTGNLLILSIMAYDRYIAICFPLRYNEIMSPLTLVKMILLVWIVTISVIATMFLLHRQYEICRTNIVDFYCNNPSLLKIMCGETTVSSYYGLMVIILIQGVPLAIMMYTYAQILYVCIMTNNADARQKAIQTCSSHLVVYLFLQVNTLVTLMAHRNGKVSPTIRRALGVSILIFPPLLDPIIYGLRVQKLKMGIKMLLKRNVFLK
ncbi:olfactory receptor 24 [Takifugu rubripes]|uniref:olfactory receptor 24 n=1 Tax=Takifugu rubripes TaxID=31033 RepID=UPI0002990B64|nr:olfactory receptor 24 [Takifugu rubripes]|eukprot:XP_003968670.1 PREDICTED: olfactory receptor 24-like [Takifugu rubripes]